MGWSPQNAHRYIQKQINEICKRIKVEQKTNESFRDDFSSILHFKFFTEENLMNVETKMKKYEQDLQVVRDQQLKQISDLNDFEMANGDFRGTIRNFENKMQKQRNFYEKNMKKIEREIDKARGRISIVEKDLASNMTKTEF